MVLEGNALFSKLNFHIFDYSNIIIMSAKIKNIDLKKKFIKNNAIESKNIVNKSLIKKNMGTHFYK